MMLPSCSTRASMEVVIPTSRSYPVKVSSFSSAFIKMPSIAGIDALVETALCTLVQASASASASQITFIWVPPNFLRFKEILDSWNRKIEY